MATEFPEWMQKLLAGPMWSGCDPQDIGDPLEVGVNSNILRISVLCAFIDSGLHLYFCMLRI